MTRKLKFDMLDGTQKTVDLPSGLDLILEENTISLWRKDEVVHIYSLTGVFHVKITPQNTAAPAATKQ